MRKALLKNCWYVVAFSDEIKDSLFERTVAEQSLLVFRSPEGKVVVLANACPHRYAPLSMGKLKDGVVECAYHGMRFNSEGNCVHNPHGKGEIPRKACIKSYPVLERHGLIWVWFGDTDKVDENTIPDFSCLIDPDFVTIKGVIEMDANYELITDNLMDLSHVEYVHEGVLGSEAMSRGEHQVHQDGTTVWSNRWCPDGKAPPAWSAMFDNYEDDVDLWMYMRWDAPAHLLLDVGITPKGGLRQDGIFIYGTDILTPKDETRSWYFWGISRNYKMEDPEATEQWVNAIEIAFEKQDKPMIEAQQKMLQSLGAVDITDLSPILLPSDAGAMRVRRTLNLLRESEKDGVVPGPRNISLKELAETPQERDAGCIRPVV